MIETETAADSFLNWVRESFEGTKGAEWSDFYEDSNRRIGIFLRNAVVYGLGMLQHYQAQGVIPQAPIATSSKSSVSVSVRQTPNSLIGATNLLFDSSSPNLPNSTDLYGVINENPGDGSPYWLLVADASDRLVWMASTGLDIDTPTLNGLRDIWGEFDETLIAPDKPYSSNDLKIILGVNLDA